MDEIFRILENESDLDFSDEEDSISSLDNISKKVVQDRILETAGQDDRRHDVNDDLDDEFASTQNSSFVTLVNVPPDASVPHPDTLVGNASSFTSPPVSASTPSTTTPTSINSTPFRKRNNQAATNCTTAPTRPIKVFHNKAFKKCVSNLKAVPISSSMLNDSLTPNDVKTPLSYFENYFPDSFFEKTATYTAMYSMSKFGKQLDTSSTEIKKLFGVHLIMGSIPYPRLRMYFSRGYGLHAVKSVLSRDRVFRLRNCLHLVDVNSPPANNNNFLWKIQPIVDTVRQGCLKIARTADNYSIDEQMIPFCGRCEVKQYVPNKPRPVGLKNFVITTSAGLMIDFEVYQGSRTPLARRDLGLGPAVVLRLAESVPKNSHIFFDRYFTTVRLIQELREDQKFGTGTIMSNRLNLKWKKDSKMKRGEHQQFLAKNGRKRVYAVKWKDNKSVTLVSSKFGALPTVEVKRWDKKEKQRKEIPCPSIVWNYNQKMGGVDILDQMLEYYRTFIRTRKWTLKCILHFLDLGVTNSWMEYRNDCLRAKLPKNKISDLLEFRLAVAEALCASPAKARHDASESDSSSEDEQPQKRSNWRQPLPRVDKRTDGYDHWPVIDELTTARMCRSKNCKSRTRARCTKCNVYLCLTSKKNCFREFHM